jgi:hypothetical protein
MRLAIILALLSFEQHSRIEDSGSPMLGLVLADYMFHVTPEDDNPTSA